MTIQSETNFDAFETDWQARADPASLRPYVDAVRTCPTVPAIMGYSTFGGAYNSTVRENFWGHLEDCAALGRVQDLPDLVAMGDSQATTAEHQYIEIGRSVLLDSVAAKWAHALWVEASRFYPWRLNGCTSLGLRALFDPTLICYNYEVGNDEPAAFDLTSETEAWVEYALCDHSPYRAWEEVGAAGGILDGTTAKNKGQAAREIAAWLGSNFSHSGDSSYDFLNSIQMDDAFDPAVNKTLVQGGVRTKFVSRNGCHFASRLWSACMRAVNIPAFVRYNGFAGMNHGSAFVELNRSQYVLLHADHIYGSIIGWAFGETNAESEPINWQGNPLAFMAPWKGREFATGWTFGWDDMMNLFPPGSQDRTDWSEEGELRLMCGQHLLHGTAGPVRQWAIDTYIAATDWANFKETHPFSALVGISESTLKAFLENATGLIK